MALFREAGYDSAALAKINGMADPSYPYSRAVLSASPECEVMLARWSGGRTCAPHDHGASSGWVFYLEEDFEEQGYEWRAGELAPAWTAVHLAGSYTEVREQEIHSCVCRGSGLSLHIYFPRIANMRVFDFDERRTITVADDCGAWIPDRAEQRKQEETWQ